MIKKERGAFLATAVVAAFVLVACGPLWAQLEGEAKDAGEETTLLSSETFSGLKLRLLGPALMSGRISDIAIDQDNPSTWYVGVGSGGVWKTVNAGTTWTPIFDGEASYSIGAVTLDPSNANTVWVGTGENHGGRHLGFGDGLYRSRDGGASWEKRGLEASEHISKIIVHPEDPDTVYVAAQGPLWSEGGERGLYKTTDGGETWDNILSAGEWTGVTDIMMDPRDPDRIYAATWQRHRTVAAYIGGGPESGVHMSEDGGETWRELTNGLPEGKMGKIGLAQSPMRPDVLYAAIELDLRKGGVWRSEDRGASWTKMSDEVSGGTGPHYYQELYASPHVFDRIYLVSNTSQISEDGGETWTSINNKYKHGDDHAIAFREDDPDYILWGSDGGLYESHDNGASWRFINNLPLTQFYKVSVDDREPFYQVYGGTQDNNSQGAPSRTDNIHGIRNSDWFITLFGDGHDTATEPGNPDIMYSEWQQGNLVRVDRTTGEFVYIKPQPAPGEPAERFNWDAPIEVSFHQPTRVYFASQRLWRTDDRGDTWTAISGDLTRNEDRMRLPVMGRQWSWEAGWDLYAMSDYNTITSIGESPLDEDLIYVGTDDGLIQVTEDGGETWRRIEVGSLPGLPDTAFVNDIKADMHDANTVYAAFDNHKYGDFAPYLYKSANRGRTWTSIGGDLPERHLVWRVVQDHVKPELMFAATEFGLFFTIDGGARWTELTGDVPTISFRDVVIQRREDDLVAASFGRGIYVLDDYGVLRDVAEDALADTPMLDPGRRAWWYMQSRPMGFGEGATQGNSFFRAENPDFGAVFTYYLPEDLRTKAQQRQESEKGALETWEDTPFAGFDAIQDELREAEPEIWLTVRDQDGQVVRRLTGPTTKGFHRVAWDLRFPAMQALTSAVGYPNDDHEGFLAAPGAYTVTLSQRVDGETTDLAGPHDFTVERMRTGALQGAPLEEVTAFWDRLARMQRSVTGANERLGELEKKMESLRKAIAQTRDAPTELRDGWLAARTQMQELDALLNGNQAQQEMGVTMPATVTSRLDAVLTGTSYSTYGPTPTHLEQMQYAEEEYADIRNRLNALADEDIPALEAQIIAADGPWVPGMSVPE